jgi:hypothetical protein
VLPKTINRQMNEPSMEARAGPHGGDRHDEPGAGGRIFVTRAMHRSNLRAEMIRPATAALRAMV